MIKVIQVNGTEKHLYELVAPLVMNPLRISRPLSHEPQSS